MLKKMQVGFLRCHGGVGVGNKRRGQYQCSQGMIGWEFLWDDLMTFVMEFFSLGVLPKAATSSFVALISKKDHPQSILEY